MKFLFVSVAAISSVEALVSPPTSSASRMAETTRLYSRERFSNYMSEAMGSANGGGWNENAFPQNENAFPQQPMPDNQWSRTPTMDEYNEGRDVGFTNVNYESFADQSNQYYEPNQQFDGQYQPNQDFNNGPPQQYPGEPMNQEYPRDGPPPQQQQYQPPPPRNQEFNNGFQDGPNDRFFSDYPPPPNQGFNEQPNGGYNEQPYPPPQAEYDQPQQQQQQQPPYDYREEPPRDEVDRMPENDRFPSRMNDGRLSRPSSAFSLLDEMFEDPFFDDPFFDDFFNMPTPFSMLSPFFNTRRSRRGSSSSSSMVNSAFKDAFSMLDRARGKMKDFSAENREFFQRVEKSNRMLINKAERYLNDDVACRMALGVGEDERIRLGPILASSSAMGVASVWNNGEEKRQERRDQRNLQIAVEGSDPRMEAVVNVSAFGDGEIQSMSLATRDGREISIPVIGRDVADGRYLNEDRNGNFVGRRNGPPPPGVIDAEVVEQRR